MSIYATIHMYLNNKKMKKQNRKFSKISGRLRTVPVLTMATALVVGASFVAIPQVRADRYEERIQALQSQNADSRAVLDDLATEANSYQDAIGKLQRQISSLENAITANQARQAQLQREIKAKQAQLDYQRKVLGQNIKAMYVEGEMSTVEMLATSRNLSDFVDAETYRGAVQSKIQRTLTEIARLQNQLQAQKVKVEQLLTEQRGQQSRLATQRAEQNRLLTMNQGEQNAYNSQIKKNQSKISELRRQQAIANARFIGAPGTGVACGGGYPGDAAGPWGRWGCNYPIDHNVDPWGMYNRQCVSYTAFKVAASGRHMPYWGGHGNANQWDDNARASGIPVSSTPRVGDVAVSNSGYYGHVMYVEHVYGDGTIYISQYNAGWDGKYSEARVSASGLVFIHFR